MIDTIILLTPITNYQITNDAMFTPSTKGMFNNPKMYFLYVNYPTTEDRVKNIYKPRLTIIKKGMNFNLKIEFSAPKLMFGNNIDELAENDFNKLVILLKRVIQKMGIKISTSCLKKAKVISFHPSKNIPLKLGYTSTLAIKELYKTHCNKRFDIEKIKFRNNGHSLQFYTNSSSFVIYDKIEDLLKPTKRAIDKGQTMKQRALFTQTKKKKQHPEILRLEVRLSKKRKLNKVLKQVGYPINPSFKNIFKKDLCQKIVNLYWNNFFEDSLFLFDINSSPQKLLQKILKAYPEIKPKQAIYLAGLSTLCKDEEGIRGLRTAISAYKPKMVWSRINNDLKKFKNPIFNQNLYGFIIDIKRELKEFTAYKYNEPT